MSSWTTRRLRAPLLVATSAFALGLAVWGCSNDTPTTAPTLTERDGPAFEFSERNPAVAAVIEIQNRHTSALFEVEGVVATATTVDERGEPVVLVLTRETIAPGRIPSLLEGKRVVLEVSGPIVAFKGGPGGGGGGGGVSHTAIQTPPIQLGTSGGPANDLANGYCCGGTLGSLVQGQGTQYILSNSHVFAGDVVSGGNGSVSQVGDDISQPGLIDASCNANNTQIVADLSTLSTLYPPASTPNIDASLAEVRPGMVRTDGAILEIGTLSSQTVAAFVGQAVKKSGRTTGLSRSSVSALNGNVNVGYSDECAGSSFTKSFTGQVMISNRASKFLNSGDSGSLMVEDVTTSPRAVGLLYAGSSSIAVANPIGHVLSHFNVTMVGN